MAGARLAEGKSPQRWGRDGLEARLAMRLAGCEAATEDERLIRVSTHLCVDEGERAMALGARSKAPGLALEGEACPRCGLRVNWLEKRERGGRAYYYAVHYKGREGGKKVVSKCYLGPKEYEYVTKTHEGLGLTLRGLVEPRRVLDYLDSLLVALPRLEASREELARIAERLELASKLIEERLRESELGERATSIIGEAMRQ